MCRQPLTASHVRPLLSCPPRCPPISHSDPSTRSNLLARSSCNRVASKCAGRLHKVRCQFADAVAHSTLTPRPQRRRTAAHFRRLHGSEVAAVKRCLVARIKQKQLVAGEHAAQLQTCRTCDHCCRHLTLGQRLLRQRRRRRCRYIRARRQRPKLASTAVQSLADSRALRQGKPLNVESVPPRNRQAKA
jgi:hypothetical protein